MRRILPLICGIVLFSATVALAGPFDGKWKIHLVPDDDAQHAGQKEFDDTLVFTPMTFAAETFDTRNGFKPGKYDEDTRRFGPASFTSELKSDTGGTAKWTGTITATAIRGDLVWTKKDNTVLKFTYTGEKSPG